MGINLQIIQLKRDLLQVINQAKMPISIVTLVLDQLATEAHTTQQQVLQKELEEQKQQQQEKETKLDSEVTSG